MKLEYSSCNVTENEMKVGSELERSNSRKSQETNHNNPQTYTCDKEDRVAKSGGRNKKESVQTHQFVRIMQRNLGYI